MSVTRAEGEAACLSGANATPLAKRRGLLAPRSTWRARGPNSTAAMSAAATATTAAATATTAAAGPR